MPNLSPFLLIIVLVLAFFLPRINSISRGEEVTDSAFILKLIKDNQAIRDGEYYRLLTAGFFHSDIYHLLLNCWGIFIFSDVASFLSIFFGSNNQLVMIFYFAIFILGVLGGNLLSFLFNPRYSLGASSGVFAFIGFLLLVSQFNINLMIYVILSFALSTMPGSRTDIYAHLGGILVGMFIAVTFQAGILMG